MGRPEELVSLLSYSRMGEHEDDAHHDKEEDTSDS